MMMSMSTRSNMSAPVPRRPGSSPRSFSAPRSSRAVRVLALGVGDKAPAFSAKDQNGKTVSLSSLQLPIIGKAVVLAFYPSDGSPGCTKEMGAFRDAIAEFKKAGAVVVGVSKGTVESKKEFATDLDLPFTLINDENDEIRTAYGVKAELFGALPGRETFVIAKDGTIVARYSDAFGFDKHVLKSLEALEPATVMA
ncbi:hypothetical protein PPROV_000379600 [Pycnococcus provasolii]|uniref:thioredoxin-dependent peroxiredoxin n=1 Tax=Pycnococcus provasolii TaxID=41880 RepID=A0A830HD98_9CHLO|nr:hypothetical protein PPROV_000379600 [Pycnococcus provasolii]